MKDAVCSRSYCPSSQGHEYLVDLSADIGCTFLLKEAGAYLEVSPRTYVESRVIDIPMLEVNACPARVPKIMKTSQYCKVCSKKRKPILSCYCTMTRRIGMVRKGKIWRGYEERTWGVMRWGGRNKCAHVLRVYARG